MSFWETSEANAGASWSKNTAGKMSRNASATYVPFIITIAVALLLLIIGISSCDSKWRIETKPVKATAASSHIRAKVFIENSGSMDGYMCGGSEFKDAVYSYLTAVNNNVDTLELNYVNSEFIPLSFPLSDLVEHLNPASFKQAGGNRANSDFKQILRRVIGQAQKGTVVVFVSDCILDLPEGVAANYLNIVKTDINNIVSQKRRQLEDLAICIYQLESRFTGTYWCPNGTPWQLDGEKRPYYLWVIGSQRDLATLRQKVKDEDIQHGVKNYCAFVPSVAFHNKVLSGGEPADLTKISEENGQGTFDVLTNLSSTLQADKYIEDPSNYKSSTGFIRVTKVIPIKNKGEFTHQLTLEARLSTPFSDRVTLKKPDLPSWVEASNSDNAAQCERGKTFSIKYTIGGVADAFASTGYAGMITLSINK